MSNTGSTEVSREDWQDAFTALPDLESVVSTAELNRRPSRAPDYAAENRALVDLAQEMANSPNTILQKLAESALELCAAHSAGISLLEDGQKRFYWPAIAGQWASHLGGGTPREYGPCGTVLDRSSALLFSHPERYFTYLVPIKPGIEEALLIPFYVHGRAAGTIWVIAHDESRRFDTEDLRVMTNLGKFAGVAYQILASLNTTSKAHEELGQINATLLRTQKELSDSLENAAIGMHWVGPDGVILWVNRAELEMLGYAREEYVGRHIAEFHADPELIEDILQRLRRGEILHDCEARLRRKDGSLRNVLISSNVLWEDGKFIHTRCFTRDITERKKGEEAIRRLAAIVESSEDAIIVKNLDGVITDWNAGAERIFGYSAKEAVGQPITMLMPPDRIDEEPAILARIRRGERIEHYETVRRRRDGMLLNISLSVSPIVDERGRIVGASKIARDISSQVLTRLEVAESEKRLRFMADSMPEKIFTANAKGEMDYFNRQWTDLTGLSFEQLKARDWTYFIHPDDAEETVRLWQHSIRKGEGFHAVHRFRRADGVYRWHLSRAHAMRDDAGMVSMWIGSNTDIHEEKQTEEELRRLNEDLNQFAFAASHDIQEPLRMITSYSQLLVKRFHGQLGDEATKYVEFITDGTTRMRDLLADLLSFAKLSADSQQSGESVELSLILQMVTQNLKTTIEETGASVTSEPLPAVRGQQAHFVQLFQNLIGNAIKYRAESSPRVHISCEKQNLAWHFAVSDNGMGIDPQYHETIFGAFKRLHGRAISGTGIGLAICKRVIERYGGQIWVESQVNQGATFHFTLPASESPSN